MIESDDGYGVSTGYTYGYYRRLSPSWLRLMATIHSVPFPEGEPFRYFELGYGQGVSLNVHAATNPGEYWGTDYNPEHVKFARQMAEASGAPVHLLDLSFEELAERDDLPQFHVIVAHGIWSWISDSSRAAILRFVDKHLAPGGLLYLSYNALPGAASGIAVQRLIRTLTQSMDPALSESERFERARAYLRALESSPNSHFANYPKARQRLDKILNATSSYALHEYTVDCWKPMLLAEVISTLHPVGLAFIGSAELNFEISAILTDSFDSSVLNLPITDSDQKAVALRETIRDFKFDSQFRWDLFSRGSIRLDPISRMKILKEQKYALVCHPDSLETDAETNSENVLCEQLLEIFSELPYGVASVNELSTEFRSTNSDEVLTSVLMCAGAGVLHPANENPGKSCKNSALQFNKFNLNNQFGIINNKISASPITGCGIPSFLKDPRFDEALSNGALDTKQLIDIALADTSSTTYSSALDLLKIANRYKLQRKISAYLEIDSDQNPYLGN